jgi:hypothetical protein
MILLLLFGIKFKTSFDEDMDDSNECVRFIIGATIVALRLEDARFNAIVLMLLLLLVLLFCDEAPKSELCRVFLHVCETIKLKSSSFKNEIDNFIALSLYIARFHLMPNFLVRR